MNNTVHRATRCSRSRQILFCVTVCVAAWSAARPLQSSSHAGSFAPAQATSTPTATDEPGSLPDLVIAGWGFTHDFITCPSFVRWDYVLVRIQNLGNARAGKFVVLSSNHRWNVAGLAPRSELILPKALGDIGLPAKIDALDEVAESNETNNFIRDEPDYTRTPVSVGGILSPLRTQPPTCSATPGPTDTPLPRHTNTSTPTRPAPAFLPLLGGV